MLEKSLQKQPAPSTRGGASVSERIRWARQARGLSQENLADALHLSTTAYGDIERGKTELTLSRLEQIARVLNVAPIELLTDRSADGPAPPGGAVANVAFSVSATLHELETLRLTVEKQRIELEKLRLEADAWQRRYQDRLALELARAIGQPERPKIGF